MDTQLDYDVTLDFKQLLAKDRGELLRELVEACFMMAELSQRIGFLRAEEVRNPREPHIKAERLEAEGLRAAYEEYKWVIIRCMDLGVASA